MKKKGTRKLDENNETVKSQSSNSNHEPNKVEEKKADEKKTNDIKTEEKLLEKKKSFREKTPPKPINPILVHLAETFSNIPVLDSTKKYIHKIVDNQIKATMNSFNNEKTLYDYFGRIISQPWIDESVLEGCSDYINEITDNILERITENELVVMPRLQNQEFKTEEELYKLRIKQDKLIERFNQLGLSSEIISEYNLETKWGLSSFKRRIKDEEKMIEDQKAREALQKVEEISLEKRRIQEFRERQEKERSKKLEEEEALKAKQREQEILNSIEQKRKKRLEQKNQLLSEEENFKIEFQKNQALMYAKFVKRQPNIDVNNFDWKGLYQEYQSEKKAQISNEEDYARKMEEEYKTKLMTLKKARTPPDYITRVFHDDTHMKLLLEKKQIRAKNLIQKMEETKQNRSVDFKEEQHHKSKYYQQCKKAYSKSKDLKEITKTESIKKKEKVNLFIKKVKETHPVEVNETKKEEREKIIEKLIAREKKAEAIESKRNEARESLKENDYLEIRRRENEGKPRKKIEIAEEPQIDPREVGNSKKYIDYLVKAKSDNNFRMKVRMSYDKILEKKEDKTEYLEKILQESEKFEEMARRKETLEKLTPFNKKKISSPKIVDEQSEMLYMKAINAKLAVLNNMQ